MKIGIISDIHDNLVNLRKALKKIEDEKIDKVFFCGDLVSPFVIDFIAEENFLIPIEAILGNNEGDIPMILGRIEKHDLNFTYPKDMKFLEEEIDGKKIAVYHGDDPKKIQDLISSGKYDLLCTGHNHHPKIEIVGATLLVNPGTISGYQEGKITNERSFAVYNTKDNQAKIFHF